MLKSVKDDTFNAIENSDCLIVIGSSLAVYSALRLAKHAHSLRKPIIIINIGETRADSLASIKIDENLNHVLKTLLD